MSTRLGGRLRRIEQAWASRPCGYCAGAPAILAFGDDDTRREDPGYCGHCRRTWPCRTIVVHGGDDLLFREGSRLWAERLAYSGVTA